MMLNNTQPTSQMKGFQNKTLDWIQLDKNRSGIEHVAFGIIVCLASIGFIGNLLALVYFMKLRKNSSYYFIMKMSTMVDCLYCVLTTFLYHYEWHFEWKLGDFVCHYGSTFIKLVFPNLSFIIVALTCYERYRNIVRPLARKTSVIKYGVVLGAFVGLCIIATYLIELLQSHVLRLISNRKKCHVILNGTRTKFHLLLPSYGIFALLPTVCIIYYYRTISNYIVKTEQKAKYVLPVFKKRQKCNRRAMRFVRLLIAVFAIPHIPARCYYYFWLYYVYTEELTILKDNWYIFTVFEYVAYVFILLTPVLKFVVYTVTIVGYRRFLLNIMTFGLFKNRIGTIFQRRPGTFSFHLRS